MATERIAGPTRGVLIGFTVLTIFELLTLTVLLVNLATVHWRPITQVAGPFHGAMYLSVVVTAMFARGFALRSRLLAIIPVFGGVLTLWDLSRARRAATD